MHVLVAVFPKVQDSERAPRVKGQQNTMRVGVVRASVALHSGSVSESCCLSVKGACILSRNVRSYVLCKDLRC